MRPRMKFDTKIAIAVRADLATWQKLNVTAFLASAVAASDASIMGEAYEDAGGGRYLPLFRQPVLVFAGDGEALRRTFERARSRNVRLAVYIEEMFATGHDEANRAAVRAVAGADMKLAGLALHEERKTADAVLKGLSLHP